MLGKKDKRYIAGLDGLRGISVLAVIAYHLNMSWAPGGMLGVTIFFVLSGYLITDLLIFEWERHGRINFKQFWFKRARRLLPAMITMLFVVSAFVTMFMPVLLPKLREESLAAYLYISNWWFIIKDVSYFESFGIPSLLTHFWSLAVEEQFYIIWPIIIYIALRMKVSRKWGGMSILAVAILSAFLMGILYQPGTDPSRVYYGTDTRAFSILIGAALAVIWPSRSLSKTIPKKVGRIMDWIGVGALFIILFMMANTNQYESFLYRGGMFLFSMVVAVLVAVLAHPVSYLNKMMSFKPLLWVGVRSYGIYLWHYPVIVLTNQISILDNIPVLKLIIQVVLILMFAALSWKWVEEPIRHGALKRLIHRIKSGQLQFNQVTRSNQVMIAFCLIIVGISTFGLTCFSMLIDEKDHPVFSQENKQKQIVIEESTTGKSEEKGEREAESSKEDEHSKIEKDDTITFIGDSVLIDVAPKIKEQFPQAMIDAKVGRQMSEAVDLIQQWKNNQSLGQTVVIELGTNGAFREQQLKYLIELIGSKRSIYFTKVKVPKPWESIVNASLEKAALEYKNITLIEWDQICRGHPEYFVQDGVHLTKLGVEVYASMLKETIE
ncbi:peptidoglycan/LPS O-acetylase OafA/YrhL [Oikeobacillus pervagus]|uniref:Peptidoglycan/LPS O-acetylase OafA/YrhL n=1 Tax=Oikeobacillus pervagus TaxID=1325931 RepID=A0AAJ1SW72_9BACI|nr:acyltransferase family protein [Oikeobacillus pervagus]MDQ0213968.1 peptidoglycan/LPS O-acetylase OafA/YrhL [Oikeobacillus pervagus]